MQFADELIKANKSFDLLYLPNRAHGFFRTGRYYTRRMWDYFVTHQLGAQSSGNYDLSPTTGGLAAGERAQPVPRFGCTTQG